MAERDAKKVAELERSARVANDLSDAQRAYILACGEHGGPYEPRHGVTANWALRHGYTETMVEMGGRVGEWEDFPLEERIEHGVDRVLGQRLTRFGKLLYDHIRGEQ